MKNTSQYIVYLALNLQVTDKEKFPIYLLKIN